MEDKFLYKLDDDIYFRKCSLFDNNGYEHGDCTNFIKYRAGNQECYSCNQEGLHFHCAQHPECELEFGEDSDGSTIQCPKCKKIFEIGSMKALTSRCLRALNREIFKGASLIRLDDWYFPELKEKEKRIPDYRLITNIKTDKDGDTIIILYVSYTGTGDKVQYFIKPEKCQLTSDHKDLDPAKIISKIEVTLKNRTLTQTYEED